MAKKLPIVFVRGYAGTQGEVEATVDDPFYGFNLGSTHIRMDESGAANFFAFESPLVRLISDCGYHEVFTGDLQTVEGLDKADWTSTIWIYRFYDPTSNTFERPGGRRLSIEEAASGLHRFVESVKKITGATKVYLVAHSMGGLVCRCLIQKIYPELSGPGAAMQDIDKLLTYGTPHGGIHFDLGAGVLERVRDLLGVNQSDDFGPDRLYQFLTAGVKPGTPAPEDFDPTFMPESTFSPDRIFCIVGTNSRDYEVAHGMSRALVGPQSDGLVQMEFASVRGSHRAYIHRSHSGRYGMVNSEEGYQNLIRFLFGDVKVESALCDFDLDYGTPDSGTQVTYQFEIQAAVRALPVLMHERSLAHFSPVSLNRKQYEAQVRKGLPLFTNFLIANRQRGGTMCYTLRLAVYCQRFRAGFLLLNDHIEQLPLWSDHLVIELRPSANPNLTYEGLYSWASVSREPIEPLDLKVVDDHEADTEIMLPVRAREVLGRDAKLRFRTFDWE